MRELVSIFEDEEIKYASTNNTKVLKQLKFLIENSERYKCYSFTGHASHPKWLSFEKDGQYTFFFDNAIYSLNETRKLHKPSFCKLIDRKLYLPIEMEKPNVKNSIIKNINNKIGSGDIIGGIDDVVILDSSDQILAIKEVDELPFLFVVTMNLKESNIDERNQEDFIWAKEHFKKREAGLMSHSARFNAVGASKAIIIKSKETYLPNNAVIFNIKRIQGFESNGLIFVSKKSDKIYIAPNKSERSNKFKGKYYFPNKAILEKQISQKLRNLLHQVKRNSRPYEYPENKAEFLKLMSDFYDLRSEYKKEFFDKFGYLYEEFEKQIAEKIQEIEDDIEVI